MNKTFLKQYIQSCVVGLIFFPTPLYAESNLFCKGAECVQYDKVHGNMGSGLKGLTKEQTDKTSGVKFEDKGYVFNKAHEKTETGYGLKFHEITEGVCLIDPQDTSKYAKIVKIDKKNKFVEFIVEKENHDYMLAWNYVSWNLPDSASLKNMRLFDCDRTPHLGDADYLKKCGVYDKKTASGYYYCSPPKRF